MTGTGAGTWTGDCPGLAWDEPGPETTITIRNDTNLPIFVFDHISEYCQWALFAMYDDQGAGPLAWWAQGGYDGLSCDDVADGGGETGCGYGDCGEMEALRLAPGASYDIPWGGQFYEKVVFPEECAESPCDTVCFRADRGENAGYTLRARAAVLDGCEPPVCMDEVGDGACWAYPYPLDCPEIHASVELDYPSPQVELVFE